uniref:Uncharacterized protein n=1 Tax=Stomoxys calcitrans TaxID=35570 RepID=A0A1I8P890_STOCA
MVCIVCKKKVAGDCFTLALESLKEHYTYYRNSFTQRDAELDKFKERNEQLNKALQLLQNEQQRRPSKKFRAHQEDSSDKHLQSAQNKNLNQNITGGLSDISLTDDETYASASHLNMALNSEQLFETSLISPAKPEASITSALELVISPRSKAAPIRRLKEKENMRLSKAKSLETSKSENYEKESSSQTNKSWAMTLLRPTTSVATSSKRMASKVGVNKKPEKKINLSLKKANPSKMKQSILQFDNCKDASLIEIKTFFLLN